MTPRLLAEKARKGLNKFIQQKVAEKVSDRFVGRVSDGVREVQSDLGLSRLPPHPDAQRKRDSRANVFRYV